jgi:hypothetical protein
MKIKLLFSLPALVLFFAGCHPSGNEHPHIVDTATVRSNNRVAPGDTVMKAGKDAGNVYKLILSLPEVVRMARYIQEHTKGSRHMEVMISQSPRDSIQNYYWVKAGEDNGTIYVTHYNFFVYPDNHFEIKYFDPINDTLMSLEDWRKENKKY